LDNPPPTWIPAFRVVDSSTSTDVHSVTGHQRHIPLPVRGEFEYQFTMQMNIPAGRYHVEAFIWDSETNAHAITGPRIQIEVLEGAQFYGAVQMNSRWAAVKSGVPGVAALKGDNAKWQTA
jgi:hypothetical protein